MTVLPPRACPFQGCGVAVVGDRYCPAHQRAPEQTGPRFKRASDAYQTVRWRNFSKLVRSCNPICQTIHVGEQCHNASTLLHHIFTVQEFPQWQFSIYTPDGRQNIVALCDHCHNPSLTTGNFAPTKKPKFAFT